LDGGKEDGRKVTRPSFAPARPMHRLLFSFASSIFPTDRRYQEEDDPMLCSACRTGNPEGCSHCEKCGAPLFVALLEELKDGGTVKLHYVFANGATIGRHPDNAIVFSNRFLSRFHARIDFQNGKFFIEDLSSNNGVLVNNARVRHCELHDFDRIALGRILLRFRTSDLGRSDSKAGMQTHDAFFAGMMNLSQRAETAVLTDEMFEIVARLAMNLTHAERAAIFLYDNNRKLQPALFHNLMQSDQRRDAFEVSQSTIAEVEDSGKMVSRDECLNDPRYKANESIQSLRLNTIICLPLKSSHPLEASTVHDGEPVEQPAKGVLFGVLYLDSRRVLKGLPQYRRAMLEVLADQVSLMIENAVLQREMAEKKKLKKQIRAASDVQERLFPQPIFSHDRFDMAYHYAPAQSICGDYVAFLPLTGSRFLFAIGDVAGKGLSAGLVVMTIHGGLHAEITHNTDLLTLIRRLDRLIYEYSQGKIFVTFFAGVLDVATMQFEYASAGHNPPLLYRHEGDDWQELTTAGIALGVDPDVERAVATMQLNPGDLLTLYTDGVIEARDIFNKQFGKQGLKKVLSNWQIAPRHKKPSLNELVNAVFGRVRHFTSYQPLYDDTTLMAVAIK
jgi:serine phosphatase RsbU (regulator of sigma subunit)/pSer/pThr/pTyr-binding forkhead associated (FHA) protein